MPDLLIESRNICNIKVMQHCTNYTNTLIQIAEDCPVTAGEVPPLKADKKTVANLQFEMIHEHPYKYSSDDVLFAVFAIRNQVAESDLASEREKFFAKGQPCFRVSPITKRYGWGLHCDAESKVALYGAETAQYEKLMADDTVKKIKASRSKKA